MANPRDWRYKGNPTVASGLEAAAEVRNNQALRESVNQPGGMTKAAAQGAAAQVATATGQVKAQAAGEALDTAGRQAGAAMGQAQVAEGERRADRRLRLTQHRMEADRALEALGEKVDRETFDDRMQFARDESGRVAMNDIQLADAAIMSAKSKEDYLNKMQEMQLASERQIQMLQAAQKRIAQTLQMEARGEIQKLNNETKAQLAYAQAEIQKKIQKARAKAANRQAQWSAGGTIAGAVIGGVVAGVFSGGAAAPAGAAVGGMVGGAAGSMAAGQVNQQEANQQGSGGQQ